MAIIRSFFAGIGFLTVVVILAIAGWLFREDIASWLGTSGGEEIVMAEPSPELAARVEETLREIAEGAGDRETRLTETELQSYLQYRLIDRLPDGVDDPAVDLRDSTLAVTAMLDFTRLAVAGAAVENLRRMMGTPPRCRARYIPRSRVRVGADSMCWRFRPACFPCPLS
ncbi:MAG: hypothetical protein MJB57_03220 [Gemmatimonadetes bacterium]|nr:hypothetical protein [Gemmatimonadota bacterium]